MARTQFCRQVCHRNLCPICGYCYSWVGEFEVCIHCLDMFYEEVLEAVPSRHHQEAVCDDETETGDLV